VAAGSNDDDHRVIRVEKAATIEQQLGTARAMTHTATMVAAAIGPRNMAYLAQAEEDDEEPALLMAQVCTSPAPTAVVQQSVAPAAATVV
jgi:hypothetical protein